MNDLKLSLQVKYGPMGFFVLDLQFCDDLHQLKCFGFVVCVLWGVEAVLHYCGLNWKSP